MFKTDGATPRARAPSPAPRTPLLSVFATHELMTAHEPPRWLARACPPRWVQSHAVQVRLPLLLDLRQGDGCDVISYMLARDIDIYLRVCEIIGSIHIFDVMCYISSVAHTCL
jgi:hypothetical protein